MIVLQILLALLFVGLSAGAAYQTLRAREASVRILAGFLALVGLALGVVVAATDAWAAGAVPWVGGAAVASLLALGGLVLVDRRAGGTEWKVGLQRTYFDELFEASAEAMVLLDREGRTLRVNEAFVALFGYGSAELAGRELAPLAPDGRLDEVREQTRRILAGEVVSEDVTRRRKDGTPVEVSVTGTSLESQSTRGNGSGM